jgi:hypothetical protein
MVLENIYYLQILNMKYVLWRHNVKWRHCVGHNVKCHYVQFHHGTWDGQIYFVIIIISSVLITILQNL